MNNKLNIPVLRFPEFREEWDEKNFSDLYNFGRTNSLSRDKLNYEAGEIFNIHYGDIHTKYKSTFKLADEKVPLINDESAVQNTDYVGVGDIIIADASEDYDDIGKTIEIVSINEQIVVSGLHTIFGKKKNNNLATGFIGYSMQSPHQKLRIKKIAQGVKVLGLPKRYVKDLEFHIPEFPEQQNIATFLTSIDGWIENLRMQKMTLEQYKKGMMQKIFSQEIRFKDDNGKDIPEWEEKRLGELFIECTERKDDQKFDMLSVSQSLGIVKQDTTIKKDSSSSNKSNYKIVKVGDIAYNTMRMWQGASGVSSLSGIVSPAYTVVRLKSGDTIFFGYLFKYPRTIFDFYRYSQGLTSDTWNLKFRHFSEVVVKTPTSVKEQQKIAEFLSSLDALIDSKQKQIMKAEKWKKGLMQRMFV